MKEIRTFRQEIRASSDGRTLNGHAVVWNAIADLGSFKERFVRGAFSKFLANGGDARALWNHQDAMILGRQSAGTLRLAEDEIGLAFEIDIPETSYGNDALISIRRKDITNMSFGFTIEPNGERLLPAENLREVQEAFLYEVSPVTFPAYEATTVDVRCDPDIAKRFAALRTEEPRPAEDLALYFRKKKLAMRERGFRN